MKTNPRILLIEDDLNIATGLQKVMRTNGYDVIALGRGDQGLERAIAESFDVVVTDLKLPGLDGLELVRQLHQTKPKLPIILITAHGTTETAIEATKWGAFDYVPKPFEVDELLDLTAKALESSRLMSDPVEIGDAASARTAIVGNSRVMQGVYKEIGRIAATAVTVLIRGDTGTGKELIARAIYQHSDRANAPFIAINCAAIPETLLESELFGHERGSFTGADARRVGRFEQADGGTIFLDEIGDMNAALQAKLLRVLQEKTIQRVGGKETIAVDTRIIAATHRDLEAAIRERLFREDLYYRLSVVTIQLPPLAQRCEDIPDMVRYFLRRHGPEAGVASPSITPEAIAYLQNQSWPGNVRELENVVRKALLVARDYTISLDHMKDVLAQARNPIAVAHQSHATYITDLMDQVERGEVRNAFGKMLSDLEPELYSQAIRRAQGNLTKAAQWLGVTRLKMREKLKEYGLHPRQEKD
ncbi:MAG TPA: sigma-54 dependent transcriptional regulator [Candidatus Paceibacterota bacterium]|nr:sigma-54 dependent transcriptional regulator [Verrucomicrobiota bacterium]HRY50415.1 sigma-54 dependent transcriptional regulator [Candidatus Paceibacterota bacterium]HRZ99512.1 sigma-54 dependent transcriptional regulator [Candidatus Paceibacterota bacterium]